MIELIVVMLVVSILGAYSTSFVVSSTESYHLNRIQNRLLAKGRLSLEQMTRMLRSAVPNSIRVSPSGNCVEFLPSVGAAFYEAQVSDVSNGIMPMSSSVSTSPFLLDLGSAEHVVIGSFLASEIYSSASPSARAEVASTVGSPISQVNFSLPHRFIRNSNSRRVYLADDPVRFCLNGGSLWLYDNYGLLTTAINDGNPGGNATLMSDSVTTNASAFSLQAGTQARGAALSIALTYAESDIAIDLNQVVLARNVP